jgi:hypothetical protein
MIVNLEFGIQNPESRIQNMECRGTVKGMFPGLLVLVCAMIVPVHMAYALNAGEIIGKCRTAAYSAGKDSRSTVRMVTKSRGGAAAEKEMTLLRINVGDTGGERCYIRLNEPAGSEGITYMMWKSPDGEDDVWQYVPGDDSPAHFPAGDERSAFEGSCLVFEDISGRGPLEDTHSLFKDESDSYVVKSVPVDPGAVEFSYYLTWVDKSTYLPRRVDSFDRSGRHYKTSVAAEVKEIQGIPTVISTRTETAAGMDTVWSVIGAEYDLGMSEDIFTERSMKEPPVELGEVPLGRGK